MKSTNNDGNKLNPILINLLNLLIDCKEELNWKFQQTADTEKQREGLKTVTVLSITESNKETNRLFCYLQSLLQPKGM